MLVTYLVPVYILLDSRRAEFKATFFAVVGVHTQYFILHLLKRFMIRFDSGRFTVDVCVEPFTPEYNC